jgi:proliferating cell nuclear antigen
MLHLVSIQASAIKSTFECLKDVLNDVNIYFRPNGIYMTTLDTARTSLVDLALSSDNFEEYSCTVDEIIAGVSTANMFKLLKSITNSDVLRIGITSKEHMDIEISNESKRTCTKFQLKLLDINESRITLPDIETSITTTLSAAEFQKYIRDMSNIGTEIEITREANKITFACNDGDFANQETSIETLDSIDLKLTGLYSLKYLNIFSKAATMCSSVQICQEEMNRFMILNYRVACLGSLSFYLATKIPTQS